MFIAFNTAQDHLLKLLSLLCPRPSSGLWTQRGKGPFPCCPGEADCEQVNTHFSQLQTLVSVRKEGKQDDGLESVGGYCLILGRSGMAPFRGGRLS